MNKKKIVGIILTVGIIIVSIAITYAITLDPIIRQSNKNNKLLVGDVYINYKGSNSINLEITKPTDTYDPNDYFLFTISGKNTNINKDVYYDIVLDHGDTNQTRNKRLDDKFLKFTLIEINNNVETTVVDGESYNSIGDKTIYTATIPRNTSSEITITYKLYVWINGVIIGNTSNADYTSNEWNNDIFASINVSAKGYYDVSKRYSSDDIKVSAINRENDGSNCKTYINEDGITYISGSSDCINFNYIWYSGYLWRVTAIYPDGSMKLITEKNVEETRAFDTGGSVNFYTDENNNSTIYQYLNNNFLSTLNNYEDFVDTTKYWNATVSSSNISTKLPETTMISTSVSPVGLLNSYEYWMSYQNTYVPANEYLYKMYKWLLLNPYDASHIWYVGDNGYGDPGTPTSSGYLIRPSIYLKSGISLSGSGTKESPYKIIGDEEPDIVYQMKFKQETTNCKTYVNDYDSNNKLEATYVSGTNDCINFNYVWWSGKMWRITAIYPDGSMKMVTDNNITSIAFHSSTYYYDKSYGTKSNMFQWLNEDFIDTLYNKGVDVIDYSKYWNTNAPLNGESTNKLSEKDSKMISTTTSPIGLLNSYDYNKSYQNTSYSGGYLNIGYRFWLLNITSTVLSNNNVFSITSAGAKTGSSTSSAYGVRPSIYLKRGITMYGEGTKTNPYRLTYDFNNSNTNDSLYTRHSGEYIKFDTDASNGNYDNAPLYRIVGVEGEGNTKITKIVSMNYATYDNNGSPANTKLFASTLNFGATGNTESNNYWDYYLNNDWYDNLSFKSKIVSGTYYIGIIDSYNYYKLAVCQNWSNNTTASCLSDPSKRVPTAFFGNVGLLRHGEMFATQQGSGSSSSDNMWLITRSKLLSSDKVIIVNNEGYAGYSDLTSVYAVRPSMYLKSSVKILSGSGTEFDPYIVS